MSVTSLKTGGVQSLWALRAGVTLAGAVASLALGAATAHALRIPSEGTAAPEAEVAAGAPAFEEKARANAVTYAYVPAPPGGVAPQDDAPAAHEAQDDATISDEARLQDVSGPAAADTTSPTGSADDVGEPSDALPDPLPAVGRADTAAVAAQAGPRGPI